MDNQKKSVIKIIVLASQILVVATAIGHAQQNEFVRIPPDPKSHAWWLRAEFHPFGTEVRGIPVAKIRKTWCKATEFRKELFPAEAKPYFKNTAGLAFRVDGSFDGSRIPETALIGAYETCAGAKGSFLLVIARPPNKPSIVRFVHEMPDQPFGMLAALPDRTLQVFHCLECDLTTRFKWDKSQRRFLRLPADKDE